MASCFPRRNFDSGLTPGTDQLKADKSPTSVSEVCLEPGTSRTVGMWFEFYSKYPVTQKLVIESVCRYFKSFGICSISDFHELHLMNHT